MMLVPLSGRIDLALPWHSKTYESVNASSAVVVDNRVLISASYQTGAAMVEIPAVGRRQVAWVNPSFDLHFTTAIHPEGYQILSRASLFKARETWTLPVLSRHLESHLLKASMVILLFPPAWLILLGDRPASYGPQIAILAIFAAACWQLIAGHGLSTEASKVVPPQTVLSH